MQERPRTQISGSIQLTAMFLSWISRLRWRRNVDDTNKHCHSIYSAQALNPLTTEANKKGINYKRTRKTTLKANTSKSWLYRKPRTWHISAGTSRGKL